MSMLRNLAIAALIVGSASIAFAQGPGTSPSGTSGTPPSGTNASPQGVSPGASSTAAKSIHHARKGRHLYNKTASRPSKKIYNKATRSSKRKIYNRMPMSKTKSQPTTPSKTLQQKPQGAQ